MNRLVPKRRALSLVLAIGCIAGACLPSSRASVPVVALEAGFPTILALGLKSYQYRVYNPSEPICEAIRYRRGAFTTRVDDPCGLFADDPGGDQVPFDDTALADAAQLRKALSLDADSVKQIQIQIQTGPHGVASGSFSADGCVDYIYSPSWTSLPESVPGRFVSKAIDRDWYATDFCP